MICHRLNRLAPAVFGALLSLFAGHASAASCVDAAMVHTGALRPSEEDVQRMARAYRDLIAAEDAVRDDPAAAASFGPLLRDARAKLEAGFAAIAEHAKPAAPTPAVNHGAHAIDTGLPGNGLQLRRPVPPKPLIWA